MAERKLTARGEEDNDEEGRGLGSCLANGLDKPLLCGWQGKVDPILAFSLDLRPARSSVNWSCHRIVSKQSACDQPIPKKRK